MMADCGGVDKLSVGFEKLGDEGEDFRRKFADGCEGIPSIPCLPLDFWDP